MALPEVMIGAPETVGGAFAAAPAGTELPTDATTPLGDAFKTRGRIGEDGWTLSANRETTDIKVWGGVTVRRLTTDYTETVKATFMESTNAETLKALFGDENVIAEGKKLTVKHTAAGAPEMVWAITMKDGEARRRLVIPKGQLFLTGDITYVHSDVIKYSVEITCYEKDGVTTTEYVADGSDDGE